MGAERFAELLLCFAEECKRLGLTGPQILLVGNHDSHERGEPIRVAMRNNIILIEFPFHCTHPIQMLDISFFKPLKCANSEACVEWMDKQALPYISKKVFLELFRTAWTAAAKPIIAKNGWRSMGLTISDDKSSHGQICIDPNAIQDHKIAAGEKYRDDA